MNNWVDDRLVGPFLEVDCLSGWHFIDLWNHQPVKTESAGGKTVLSFREESASPMYVVAGFPSLIEATLDGGKLSVRVENPPAEAEIEINTVDNLTLLEEEMLTLPAGGGTVDTSSLKLDFPYIILIKLKAGGILLDEIILESGWKKF